jgi:hypothetical protein
VSCGHLRPFAGACGVVEGLVDAVLLLVNGEARFVTGGIAGLIG